MTARTLDEAIKNAEHHVAYGKQLDEDYIGDSTVQRIDLEVLLQAAREYKKLIAVLPGVTLAELQAQVKAWTAEKGWDDDRTVGDLLMLMVSELSEALEEYRNPQIDPFKTRVVYGKPEGIPPELADVVIRILSFCGKFDIDLQEAVLQKMAYNVTREHRHGGKRV